MGVTPVITVEEVLERWALPNFVNVLFYLFVIRITVTK